MKSLSENRLGVEGVKVCEGKSRWNNSSDREIINETGNRQSSNSMHEILHEKRKTRRGRRRKRFARKFPLFAGIRIPIITDQMIHSISVLRLKKKKENKKIQKLKSNAIITRSRDQITNT